MTAKPKTYLETPIKVPRFEESAGFYTTEERSKLMSRISRKDTKPELEFRRVLWKAGVRFRIHSKSLPGKPDISNKALKFVVFIDGEFWHGHDWHRKKKKLKTNAGFWIPKIERNIQRDKHINMQLESMGFRVFRFWDLQVRNEPGACLKQVLDFIGDDIKGK
jgi:DNA mismatch endonuclease (patch repair protein)